MVIRVMIHKSRLWKLCIWSETGLTEGCNPICQGVGWPTSVPSSARASAGTKTASNAANAALPVTARCAAPRTPENQLHTLALHPHCSGTESDLLEGWNIPCHLLSQQFATLLPRFFATPEKPDR